MISVKEAKGTETALEVVEKMQFDQGYLSPYFVTDAERMERVLHLQPRRAGPGPGAGGEDRSFLTGRGRPWPQPPWRVA